MSVLHSVALPCKNHLLSLLSKKEMEHLTSKLTSVRTTFKQILFTSNSPIEYVYFPCTSVFSILSFMQNGTAVEVGTVGNEGFAGIDVLIGAESATDTTICQVEGDSLRMRTSDFCEAVATDTPLRRVAQRYLQAYVSQMS